MRYKKMTVIMSDGLEIIFFKGKKTLELLMFNGEDLYENLVREGSIHAVVGEPLTFTYYYGNGNIDEA